MKTQLRNAPSRTSAIINRSLWLIVLSVILSVSAYSFYVIARHFGVPPLVAAGMSTVFDGTALLAANYSVRYAEEGLSGSFPRTIVRIFAILTAYLQTFHSLTGDGSFSKSWILWASLPIAAMLVYEIHIRWARRGALIAAGSAYSTPLPAFGVISWVLNPFATFTAFRSIVANRRAAVLTHALTQTVIVTSDDQLTSVRRRKAAKAASDSDVPKASDSDIPKANAKANAHAPVIHMRQWAKEHEKELGVKISDRARLPKIVIEAYAKAHAV